MVAETDWITHWAHRPLPPLVLVLSGPSGVGKDAVLSRLREQDVPFHYTVTATTRARRQQEIDGLHYHFVTQEQFEALSRQNELLEAANVYGHYYGVPKAPIRQALARGQDVIIKPDVQGALTLKALIPQGVFVFLTPPSMAELELRLCERQTETQLDLERRLQTARDEMRYVPLFDYCVVNHRGRIDAAVTEIKAILCAEKARVNRPPIIL